MQLKQKHSSVTPDSMFKENQQRIKSHLKSAYFFSDAKVDEIYPQFIATIKSMLADLENISRTGDINALSHAGHAIKGALLNLGLSEHADIAQAIEKYHLRQDQTVDVMDLITQLKQKLNWPDHYSSMSGKNREILPAPSF